jgi:hypothetical protein
MLGFIVPVKPRQYSGDWALNNLLLERTARSLCNQDAPDFKLFIVYTDKPEINYKHENIYYLHFPYPEVAVNEITDFDELKKWYTPVFAERMMDKARKIIFGCEMAKSMQCNYLMGVDSDDLVSSKICSFVNNSSKDNPPGWRINKGYVYEENSSIAIKNKQIWGMNGSTHIIREDLINIPDFSTDFNLFHYTLFQSHSYTYQRLIDYQQVTLGAVPFYGVIYVIHSNNYSAVKEIISANSIKLLIKKVVQGKWINSKLKSEFGLYPIDSSKLTS